MSDPWEWNEGDIETLIKTGVQESPTLDYKRSAALDRRNPKSREDLCKDVSAFANSGGGVLVYGVEEDNHLPKRIDEGFDPRELTREWIDQIINSSIQRRIDGIRIKQIELHKNSPGRVAYVVYVPQSKRAPHMASDHIFYKRYNFISVPMEEYEVRDVANRLEGPSLNLTLALASPQPMALVGEPDNRGALRVDFDATLINTSATPAYYHILVLQIERPITIVDLEDFYNTGQSHFTMNNQQIDVNSYAMNSGTPAKMPIWEGVNFKIMKNKLTLFVPPVDRSYKLRWTLRSPSMSERQGLYTLTVSLIEPAQGLLEFSEVSLT